STIRSRSGSRPVVSTSITAKRGARGEGAGPGEGSGAGLRRSNSPTDVPSGQAGECPLIIADRADRRCSERGGRRLSGVPRPDASGSDLLDPGRGEVDDLPAQLLLRRVREGEVLLVGAVHEHHPLPGLHGVALAVLLAHRLEELLALDIVRDDRRDRDAVVTRLALALDGVEGREAVGDLALHVGAEVVGVDRVAADLHPELLVEVAGVVVGAAAAGEGEGGACGEGGGEGVTGLHGVSPVRRGDIQVRRWSVVGGRWGAAGGSAASAVGGLGVRGGALQRELDAELVGAVLPLAGALHLVG